MAEPSIVSYILQGAQASFVNIDKPLKSLAVSKWRAVGLKTVKNSDQQWLIEFGFTMDFIILLIF